METRVLKASHLAELLEEAVRHRKNNSVEAAKILREAGLTFDDDRATEIITTTISHLTKSFIKHNGQPRLTNVLIKIGMLVSTIIDKEMPTYLNLKVGAFILSVFSQYDAVRLVREGLVLNTTVSYWEKVEDLTIKYRKNKKKWKDIPYVLEPGPAFSTIDYNTKAKVGIRSEQYPKWNNGTRNVDGTKQKLVKSNAIIPNEDDDAVYMRALKVLEDTQWSIDPNVAQVSKELGKGMLNTTIELDNNIMFDAADIYRVSTNEHLQNLELTKGSLPFRPELGDANETQKYGEALKESKRRYESVKSEKAKAKHLTALTEIEERFNTLNTYWLAKQECLKISSRAARANAILETIHGNSLDSGWLTDSFYLSHFLDYRGRNYAVDSQFSWQGDDFAKGHLTFEEAIELTPTGISWIFVHTANSYGMTYSVNELKQSNFSYDYASLLEEEGLPDICVDKMSLDDRYQWTYENLDFIQLIANDPIEHKDMWMVADKPWTFLQMCFEINNILIAEDKEEVYFSNVIVPVDASNSGLQHLTAMGLDASSAPLVGLEYSEVPKDFYVLVGKGIVEINKGEALGDRLDELPMSKIRKCVAKRGTMTRHYDAGATCIANIIQQDSYSNGLIWNYDEAKKLGKDLITSYNDLCEGPMLIKEYIQGLVKHRINDLEVKTVDWVSPSGFPVLTEKFLTDSYATHATINGKRLHLVYREYTDIPLSAEHTAAIGANLVHAMDGAHLALTVVAMSDKGVNSFAACHDSFGVHASKVDMLVDTAKDEFIKMYSVDILEDLRGQLTWNTDNLDKPKRGEFNLESIRKSDFFFS